MTSNRLALLFGFVVCLVSIGWGGAFLVLVVLLCAMLGRVLPSVRDVLHYLGGAAVALFIGVMIHVFMNLDYILFG